MHLLEISIFSLNNDLVRLTKIMNILVKDLRILSFKVIFQCLQFVKSFQKIFYEEYLIRRPTYNNEIFWKLWFLKYFIYQKCAQFLSTLFIILVGLISTRYPTLTKNRNGMYLMNKYSKLRSKIILYSFSKIIKTHIVSHG